MKQTYLYRPKPKIDAVFSSEDNPIYCYQLVATVIGSSAKPKSVCAIMQNPSYAGAQVADRSVQVLERVVFEKDYEEFVGVERMIIVNQFAFIQTNDFVGTIELIGRENERFVSKAIEESEIIQIAWGKDNGFHRRQTDILNIALRSRNK